MFISSIFVSLSLFSAVFAGPVAREEEMTTEETVGAIFCKHFFSLSVNYLTTRVFTSPNKWPGPQRRGFHEDQRGWYSCS